MSSSLPSYSLLSLAGFLIDHDHSYFWLMNCALLHRNFSSPITLCYNLDGLMTNRTFWASVCGKVNNVLCYFNKCDPLVRLKLIRSYCSDLYGSVLWDMSHSSIDNVCIVGRLAYRLFPVTHRELLRGNGVWSGRTRDNSTPIWTLSW